jgi:hypothetical protein
MKGSAWHMGADARAEKGFDWTVWVERCASGRWAAVAFVESAEDGTFLDVTDVCGTRHDTEAAAVAAGQSKVARLSGRQRQAEPCERPDLSAHPSLAAELAESLRAA